jgi:hypothetical protein
VNLPRKVQGPLGKSFGLGFFETAPGSPSSSTSSYTDGKPILCFVTGIGDVGKTRLAQEYANRHSYSSHFHWIFWVNAEDVTSVSLSYRTFAKRLGITAPRHLTCIVMQILLAFMQLWKDLSMIGTTSVDFVNANARVPNLKSRIYIQIAVTTNDQV